GAAVRRINRQRKTKAWGVEWARTIDAKWDCSSHPKVTGGARGTGIVELLMTREKWSNMIRQCPNSIRCRRQNVLAQDLRNGHLVVCMACLPCSSSTMPVQTAQHRATP